MNISNNYPLEWGKYSADELFTIRGGTTPSKKNKLYWDTPDIHWATPTDFTKNEHPIYINRTASKISHFALDECGLELINPGSVLMTSRATIGKTLINTIPITTNQGFVIFTPSKKIISKFFLYWLQNSNKMLTDMASGSTFLEISKKTIRQLQITLPPLPEQKKIASILSSVDDAIQTTQKVIDQTEKVKQGLLQSLLTKGIGHSEFKKTEIGEIPLEWEVTSIKDISKRVSVGHVGETSSGYTDHGIIFLRTMNVRKMKIDISDVKYVTNIFSDKHKKSVLSENDIVISRVGANRGMAAVLPPELSKCNCANIIFIRPDNKIISDFVAWYLNAGIKTNSLMGSSVGSAQGVINTKSVERFKIPLPTINEQTQIVSILNNLNYVIKSNQNQIRILNKKKKGLMQDLLTGKVRV